MDYPTGLEFDSPIAILRGSNSVYILARVDFSVDDYSLINHIPIYSLFFSTLFSSILPGPVLELPGAP
jgi:hypothetical protein